MHNGKMTVIGNAVVQRSLSPETKILRIVFGGDAE